jgi:histidinol-phosphate aminotransferase
MSLSRRQFLTNSTMSAASIPLLLSMDIDYCEAASPSSIDWSMGFPKDAVLLNRNENPIGPSPLAIEAARDGIPRAFRYADPDAIRKQLAEHYQMDKQSILVGSGSGELLKIAPLAFATEGNIVSTLESYRSVAVNAERFGANVKWVNLIKERNYANNIQGLLSAVDSETRILFAVTPNNPTGLSFTYDELKTIADEIPKHVLFVIDEAYIDLAPPEKTGIDLVREGYSNVLVTRTFSKAYAMAGLRCGYGIGHPDIMKIISRYGCGPTSTNMAGFGAMAASLEDKAHLQRSREFAKKTRALFESNFKAMGIPYLSGPTLFIMAEFGNRVEAINKELRKRKIFVRPGGEWDLPEHIRISYGHEHEVMAFFDALKKIL